VILRRWQIAAVALGLIALTLLIINFVLRARVDSVTASEAAKVATTAQLQQENAELRSRTEQLLTQLSTSNERLTDLTSRLNLTNRQLAAADADVQSQVAAQRAAARVADRADGGLRRARAQAAALRAQLRNAQTCSAAAIKALGQIHSGPDIESGADEAAATLESVLPACRAGLE
jgi:chromosome segregation ATPase